MPFDGVIVKQPRKIRPIHLIERMIILLDDKVHWTQHLERTETDHGATYCIVGAMYQAARDYNIDPRDAKLIQATQRQLARMIARKHRPMMLEYRITTVGLRPQHIITEFNDNPRTSHQMVMDVLFDTRHKVEPQWPTRIFFWFTEKFYAV